ncbi:hypothetical protein BBH99_10650 [Chryseobacterium contaminans]|uniref:Uncharacterized protein n=1 Tax=Chryseobacterium contaminans TaxID=1423959 RepID=A0A1M7B3V6_9FLAO|nr:hypothetical protein [Chryseobacterium contaminans]OCA77891.1 hypothetical protein BBH99_10650 [Chryseobacterium contaminans]SHL49653.1 hypothetical protein SAMN05444407_104226 [Chryseobacterium contaminans]
MKNRIFHLLVFTTFFLQCQNKKEQENIIKPTNTTMQENISTNQVKDILEKQTYLENEETEDKYTLSKIDLDILSDLISKDLKSKGYKEPSSENFSKKINSIFGLDIKCIQHGKIDTRYLVYHGNLLDGSQNTLEDNLFESFTETGNIFFDQKNKLLTPFVLLKNIVTIKGQNYSTHIPQNITAQNKYLFNDSKADLAWLKFNDKTFLETLVKDFGYVKDKDLLEWYIKGNGIEKYSNDKETYLKVFYTKNCDNSFNVHSETFSYMDSDPEKYSKEIISVLEEIRTDRIKLENLDFHEKSKLIAYLLYFGEKHKEKTGLTFSFMGTFYEHSQEDLQKKYDEEFKKQKYYGLPSFEKYWNEAKIEGDGIGLDM